MNRRRAAIATVATVGIAAALATSTGEPRRGAYRAYLPIAPVRVYPTATPPPTPARVTFRPADAGALIDAMTVPGALVLPAPGLYALPVQARVASGVTVEGRERVTITGRGLSVKDARGVTIAGLDIRNVAGDGITVLRGSALVDRVRIGYATDGLLDLYGGSTVTVRDSLFHDGQPRGSLCGNSERPNDGRERLVLERVTFRDVPVRTPKLIDCDLVARDLTIIRPGHYGLDARGSSTADITGLVIEFGPKTRAPGWTAEPGATVRIR